MNPKQAKLLFVSCMLAFVIYGAFFGGSARPLRALPAAQLACTSNAECTVRGKDEWERCHHVNDPLSEDKVATGAGDATSKTHDGYACMCVAQKCQWAGKDYQACVNTGGKFSRREDCPPCPPNAACEACFVGCQCPFGKSFDISVGCK